MKNAPSSATPALRDFSDHLGPMVVKELRHGLRTRFFTMALIAFHWLLLMLMAGTLIGISAQRVTEVFWFIAIVTLLGLLPLRGFATLSAESENGTLDMLTLASMSSFRIVWGKWVALVSQSLLVAVSLLPYLVARYQFGGVEIVRESLALALLVLGSAIATAALVGFSSQPAALRFFLAVGVGAALFPLGLFTYFIAFESVGDNMLREFLGLTFWEQGAFIAGYSALAAYAVFFFLSLGASRIAAAAENHSTRKRLVALGFMSLVTVVGCGLTFTWEPKSAFLAFLPSIFLAICIGMDVLTEPMPRVPVVVLPFVRRGGLGRLLGNLLYPGWASAAGFYVIIATLPYVTLALLSHRSTGVRFGDEGTLFTSCLLLAPMVPLCIPINRNRFVNWWAVQFALIAFGILLSIFCGVTDSKSLAGIGVLTPVTTIFGGMLDYSHDDEILGTGVVIGIVWLLAALGLALRELQIYRELEAEAVRMQLRESKSP